MGLDEIQHSQNVLRRLRNPNWKRNSRVKELLSKVDWNKDTFQLKFIALGIEAEERADLVAPWQAWWGHFKGGGVVSRQFAYNVSVS